MNRFVIVKAGFLALLLSSVFVAVGLVPILAQSPSPLSTMDPGTTVDVCPSPAASPAEAAASPVVAASPDVMTSPAVRASPGVAASPGVMASPAPGACPTGAITEAAIFDFEFEPAELTIGVGTTVRWTNDGPSPHTVTADDGSFDSGEMGQAATFEHTFDTAGTFSYFCEIHPAMTGTVTVQ